MGRKYVGDTWQVGAFYTSGNNTTSTGAQIWLGQVQNHDITESEGASFIRYAGTADRNVDGFYQGETSYEGTLTFFPQNFRFLKFALGKVADAGSPSPFTHTYTETNNDDDTLEVAGQSLPSMNIEDAKQVLIGGSGLNHIRTMKGCMIDSLTITGERGAPISVELNYMAISRDYASGAASSLTEVTDRPYIFSDLTVHWPSGTTLNALKTFNINLANNLQADNYLDNSRNIGTPIPGDRDYELALTMNADSAEAKNFYDKYFIGGSEFNMLWHFVASTGSRTLPLVFSGCRLRVMNAPSLREGVHEYNITIQPTTASAVEDSTDQYYNAGSYS